MRARAQSLSLQLFLARARAGERARSEETLHCRADRRDYTACSLCPSLVKIKLRLDPKAKSRLVFCVKNVPKSGFREAYATVSRIRCSWKLTRRIPFVLALLS